MAIEKAVIFRFAVTPLISPGLIAPALYISKA